MSILYVVGQQQVCLFNLNSVVNTSIVIISSVSCTAKVLPGVRWCPQNSRYNIVTIAFVGRTISYGVHQLNHNKMQLWLAWTVQMLTPRMFPFLFHLVRWHQRADVWALTTPLTSELKYSTSHHNLPECCRKCIHSYTQAHSLSLLLLHKCFLMFSSSFISLSFSHPPLTGSTTQNEKKSCWLWKGWRSKHSCSEYLN